MVVIGHRLVWGLSMVLDPKLVLLQRDLRLALL